MAKAAFKPISTTITNKPNNGDDIAYDRSLELERLHGQFLAAKAGAALAPPTDSAAAPFLDREEAIMRQIAATPAGSVGDLAYKLAVLRRLLLDLRESEPRRDRLDLLILGSIEADIEALAG